MITGVVTDSRQVEPGHLFVALEGARVDGHDFLREVAERGAVSAIVSEQYGGESFGLELIHVADPLLYLQELAQKRVAALKAKIVAVTGSVGKTTAKGFLGTLLAQRWNTYASPGNSNSQVGVPLSILSARGNEQMLVLEMAMSEPGQIRRLTEIAPPDAALITRVGFMHAENFGSLEEIAAAKGEIFSSECTRIRVAPPGWGVRSFSVESRDADYFGELVGSQLRIFEGGELAFTEEWFFPGHLAENFVGAVALAREMGIRWAEVVAALPDLSLPARRFSVVECGGVSIVDDSYNNGPDALLSAVRHLPAGKRRIGFVSEMRELGDFSERLHDEVGRKLANHLDLLYCIGPAARCWEAIWRESGKKCVHLPDREALLNAALSEVSEGDVLLFKGSRIYALEEIAARLFKEL